MNLKQQITRISGTARIGGRDVPLDEAKLRGERFTFKLTVGGRPHEFTGMVKGSSMEGSVDAGGAKTAWSAAPAR